MNNVVQKMLRGRHLLSSKMDNEKYSDLAMRNNLDRE